MSQRIDSAMVELGLAQSRERAKALIMEGGGRLDGTKVTKASDSFSDGQVLSIKENPIPFVSRGGLKLQKAVDNYGVNLADRICIDVGASTGGFTDCMLMHGAKKVYAVDVGYGQLDWKLRNDERVICMERHNARMMEPDWFDETPSFASVDVSFISIKLILPRLNICLSQDGEAVVLVKPQFEAGRNKVGKNGVVRDKAVHLEVLSNAVCFSIENGFTVKAVDFSPITGPKGNIEFLLYLAREGGMTDSDSLSRIAHSVVSAAHDALS